MLQYLAIRKYYRIYDMKIFNNLPIRYKLMISMGTILVVALIIVVILNYIIVKNDVKNRIINYELPILIDGIEKEVNFVIEQPLSIILSTTKNPFSIDWIKRGEPKDELPYISQYYASIRENTNAFRSVIVSDKSKTYYFVDKTEIGSEPIIKGDPRHDWYFKFKESGKKYEYIIYDSGTNDWSNALYINCRLEDYNGKFIGDTGLGINLDKMVESIASKKIGKHGNTFMVSPQGVINLHKNKDLINKGNIRNIPRFAPFADKILSTNKGNFTYEGENGTIIAAVKYLPLVNWYLIVEVQESEMLANIKHALIKTGFLALAMFVIAIVLVILLSRKLTQPIKELVRTSKKLSKGDFSKKAQVKTNDELGTLAQSFNAMAEQLKTSFDTLDAKVVERTAQLDDKIAELTQTRKELVESEKMASLGGLVAGVAHEINTPIGIGVTAASTLADRTTETVTAYDNRQLKGSALKTYFNMAQASSNLVLNNLNRAAELIQSFKQVAVDQSNWDKRSFAVKKYIQDTLLNLKPHLKQTPHQITVSGDEQIEINSYPGAFSQIVTNLVMNSVRHAYPKGEAGNLRFELKLESGRLMVEYSDDGCGIPEENQEKIFEPFFTTARAQGGTGLGLHIVFNLVTQKLQGTIDVQSEVGIGTTFILNLPLNTE